MTVTQHSDAQISVKLADWDYTQQYPNNGGSVQSGLTADHGVDESTAIGQPDDDSATSPLWSFDVEANGALTISM